MENQSRQSLEDYNIINVPCHQCDNQIQKVNIQYNGVRINKVGGSLTTHTSVLICLLNFPGAPLIRQATEEVIDFLKSNSGKILQGSSNATFTATKCDYDGDKKLKHIRIIVEREIP